MELHIKPGKYIVAVSGGVDSMVLLDMLSKHSGLELVVVHFDHGIRPNAAQDRQFVADTAKAYGLSYVYEAAQLGVQASEEMARKARYAFLYRAKGEQVAQGIIMAHHQDDVLETMCINLKRGTGRKGLTSLRSTGVLVRPLLAMPKTAILAYAHAHKIEWREDSTNQDPRYLRNYLRLHVLPNLTSLQRECLVRIYTTMLAVNDALDQELSLLLDDMRVENQLQRRRFIQLPHTVACEALVVWLRQNDALAVDRKQIERLVVAAKTGRPGAMYDIDKLKIMRVDQKNITITSRNARK